MNNFTLGCTYLDKSKLTPYEQQAIKDNLTVSEYNYMTRSYDSFYYFVETQYKDNDIMIVPRYYNSVFDMPKIQSQYIEPKKSDKIDIKMIKHPTPRDPEQQKAVDFMTGDNTSGVIKAYTGFGKTWCTIRAICDLQVKTIIIVDKEKLRNQWVESFGITNLTKDDIGIIKGRASFDKAIKKPIVIATVQTLSAVIEDKYFVSNNDYLKKFFEAGFQMMVLDEVHKTSTTPFFSKAATFFMTKRIYGLSATPKKSNEQATKILNSYFGNNIFVPDDSNKVKPSVIMIMYNSNIPHKTKRWISFGGRFNYVRYRKKLVEQENYIDVVNKVITTFNAKEDTTGLLFAAHEINFLETIQKSFPDSGIIHSGTDQSEMEKRLIFATHGSVTAGLSINHLNKLVIGTSISGDGNNLEQISGRITRDHTNKETNPEIIDLVDVSIPNVLKQAVSRFNEYRRLGIEVKKLIAYDDKSKLFAIDHEYINDFLSLKERLNV